RLVILDKPRLDAELLEEQRAPALHERAARIGEHLRLEHEHVGNRGFLDFQRITFSESRRCRYSPYPLLPSGAASFLSWASLIQRLRQAISSGHAIFRPWRRSMVSMKCEASRSDS